MRKNGSIGSARRQREGVVIGSKRVSPPSDEFFPYEKIKPVPCVQLGVLNRPTQFSAFFRDYRADAWIAHALVVRCEQMIPVRVPDFCGFGPFTMDASD